MLASLIGVYQYVRQLCWEIQDKKIFDICLGFNSVLFLFKEFKIKETDR